EKGAVAFNSAKYELEQSEERVKSLEELLDGIINENYELSRLLSETERKKSEAGQTSGGLEAKKAVLLNDISHYKRIIEDNEQSINTARENIMSTSEQLAQAFAAAEEARNKAGEISAEVDRAQKEYENKHNETALLQTRLSEANSFYSELFEKKAKTLSTGAKIDAELELAARSKDGTAEIIATSERRISELSADIEKAESEEKLIKTEYENLRKQKDESENTISSLKSDLERIKDELVAKRLSLAADEQKREHLNRLEKLLEGYSESVRSVISDSKQGRIKKQNAPVEIYGTVSSLITAEGEYVIALETALGAALQFIVVGNEEDAKASIEYLKDNRLGRATFLPITTVRGKRCDISEIKDIPGFIGIASDLAKYNEKYTGIIEDLLGRTVVATELNAATRIAEKSGYKIKIVTCDGQVINPGGSFTGGSSAKKVGLLTRSLDIERLSSEIKKKNSEMLDIEREAANIRKKIDDLNEKNANLELILTEKKAAFDLLSSEKNTLAVRAEEEKKRRSSLLSGKNEDDTRLAMLLKQKEEYTLILKADGEKLDSSRLMLNELKEKAEAARAQEEDIYEKLNTERIRLLEGRTSAEHLGEQVLQLTERKSGFEKQIEEMQSFIDRTKSDISACESEITKIEEERSKVASEITGFDRLMDKMLSDREQKEKEINDTRHKVKQLQSEKDEAFRRFTSLEAEQNKLNKDYEDISSKLWDEYELTYSSAVSLRLPAEKMEKAHTRISSLKSRIRAMGSINVNALEEYRQEKERYDFLTAQTEDLNKTRKSLDNAISKLNIEMKQTFVESFEKINTAFGEVFTELFGGGSAYIELADPEMPLECGIDIIIRPPGKSVKNISLLSGGEQSFAAIALYLALQKINPAPFCIFDEIESSLDDVNVNKFADYVRQNSANTQYILITHRRGTMERADTLYGITMRQKGISEYIKLNIAMLQENLKEYTG
ncbi:MAG: chromosome segregation protein SMC, partial [Eubacteriales bacterium]|nr:chromosome segregation protein SMC [Eubacteriales bacterium]